MRVPRVAAMQIGPGRDRVSADFSRHASAGDEKTADHECDDELVTPRAADTSPSFEATPMEAACKMLFGEDEAPAMIQRLQQARVIERTERANHGSWKVPGEGLEDTCTPEFRSRHQSHADLTLRRIGPPMVRPSSCQSWDWRDGGYSEDGSPREGGIHNGADSFKRVYSLCNLDHGGFGMSRDGSRDNSRGGSVSGGKLFAGLRRLDEHTDELSEDEDGSQGPAVVSKPKRMRLIAHTDAPDDSTAPLSRSASTKLPDLKNTTSVPSRFEQEANTLSNVDIARARDRQEEVDRMRDSERAEQSLGAGSTPTTSAPSSSNPETTKPTTRQQTSLRRQNSRESEDSDLMQSLRREWASMRGRPSRPVLGIELQGGGGGGGTENNNGDGSGRASSGEPKQKSSRAHRANSSPSIKQRLQEVLTPSQSVPSGCWQFNSRVTGLNLSNASIGAEGAAFLASALKPRKNADGSFSHNSFLKSLNLEFNNIGCGGVAVIAEALSPVWMNVTGGDMDSSMDSSKMETNNSMISGRWVCNSSLERLNLNFCEVGVRGAAALANAIAPRVNDPHLNGPSKYRHHGGLTHLSLFHNRLGAEGARFLAEALAPRRQPASGGVVGEDDSEFAFNPTLRSLNVGRNQLGDVGLARIASAFAPVRTHHGQWVYNPMFKHLHANANSCLSQEGPLALSESFAPRQNPDGKWAFAQTLSTIHLANVLLGEEGGKALADVFRPRKIETPLYGDQSQVPSESQTYSWTFPSNLRVLNLSKTGLGDGGAKHVADALRPRREFDGRWVHNPRLRELHLGGATIGPEGARAIANAIKPRCNGAGGIAGFDDDDCLEDTSFSHHHFTKNVNVSTYPSRTGGWVFNLSLQVLDLRDNVLGAEGVAALAEAVAPVLDDSKEVSASDSEMFSMDGSVSVAAFASPPPGAVGSSHVDPLHPQPWMYGGVLAVLNLEFNDAGAEGIAALAKALAPRWCLGMKKSKDQRELQKSGTSTLLDDSIRAGTNFAFGRNIAGNGSGNTNNSSLPNSRNASRPSSRPTSARFGMSLYGQTVSGFGAYASSPNSSGANSPALTPRGNVTVGFGNPGLGVPSHRDVETHSNNPSSVPSSMASARTNYESGGGRPTSARSQSPLAVSFGGSGQKGTTSADVPVSDPFSSGNYCAPPVTEVTAHWCANESLRALGIGGNRAGDEGASALADAIAPVINPDGTWTSLRLTKLDASDNDIGEAGLLALARAIDPKCADPRCTCGGSRSPSVSRRGSQPPSQPSSRPTSARSVEHRKTCMLHSVLSQNAKDSMAATTKLMKGFASLNPINDDDADHMRRNWSFDTAFNESGSPNSTHSDEQKCSFDVYTGLRKLDLARNNSDDKIRQTFTELKEKLKQERNAPVCDVCI